jgi:hypothetical protein
MEDSWVPIFGSQAGAVAAVPAAPAAPLVTFSTPQSDFEKRSDRPEDLRMYLMLWMPMAQDSGESTANISFSVKSRRCFDI